LLEALLKGMNDSEGMDELVPSELWNLSLSLPAIYTFLLLFLSLKKAKRSINAKMTTAPSTPPIMTAVRDVLSFFEVPKSDEGSPVLADRDKYPVDGPCLVVRTSGTTVVSPFASVTVVEPLIVCVPLTITVASVVDKVEVELAGFESEVAAVEPPELGLELELVCRPKATNVTEN
jgi:hypothetical protein